MNGAGETSLASVIAGVLQIVLLGGGLFALAFVATNWKCWKPRRTHLNAWQLGWTDFLLFICALLVWTTVSGAIGYGLLNLLSSFRKEDSLPEALFAATAGGIMQLGFILLFWRWRAFSRDTVHGRINARKMSLPRAGGFAFLFILASYPLVFVGGLLWTGLLQWMQNAGMPVDLSLQPQLSLFSGARGSLDFILLGLVAVVGAPIAEELIFRAGIYRFLLGRLPRLLAVPASAFLFACLHLHLQSFLPLMVLGGLLCVAYELSGNIRVPILMHAIFNFNTLVLVWLAPEQLTS